MKIRTGFVSNSSSSSFVALGFPVNSLLSERDLIIALGISAEEFDQKVNEILKNNESSDREKKHLISEVFYEDYDRIVYERGVRILRGSEDGISENETVIAVMLDESGSCGAEEMPCGHSSLSEEDENFKKVLDLRDKISPESKISIFYGTRFC